MQPLFVLDQNVMQRPALPRFIERNPEAGFVLPDTAFVEMSKSDQWESTFRRNLSALQTVASRCFMSLSVHEARELEIRQGHSCDQELLPVDFTQLLRDTIAGVQSSTATESMEQLRQRMSSVQAELAQHDLNAAATKAELLRRVQEIRRVLHTTELAACRDAEMGRAARVLVGRSIGDGIYQTYMKDAGASLDLAQTLKDQHGMCLRWFYMLAHHALSWVVLGGIESPRKELVLNDTFDKDYVLVGSFFAGVVSLDRAVKDSLQDLRDMLCLPPLPVEYH